MVTVRTSDITDTNVDAITLMASAAGEMPIDRVRSALAAHNIPADLMPPEISLATGLRRAMEELAKGANRKLFGKGRGLSAVYTVTVTNMERLDLDVDSGRGIADAEVSARIEHDPFGDSYTIRVTPPSHPAAPLVQTRARQLQDVYSCTYDLKVWWSQRVLPYLGAINTGRAAGEYVMSAAAAADKVSLIQAFQAAFRELSDSSGKFRVYAYGETANDANAVDMIADAIMDEAQRTLDATQAIMANRTLGKRAVATKSAELSALRERLGNLAKSFGLGLEDAESVLHELEKHLVVAEIQAASK